MNDILKNNKIGFEIYCQACKADGIPSKVYLHWYHNGAAAVGTCKTCGRTYTRMRIIDEERQFV